MIIYKNAMKDEPINRRIKRFQDIAKKWERQIAIYDERIANNTLDPDKAAKAKLFCMEKLDGVNEQLRLLQQSAEI